MIPKYINPKRLWKKLSREEQARIVKEALKERRIIHYKIRAYNDAALRDTFICD